VDRLACIDLPALPLQLLLQRYPDWVAHPAAVVAEDKPGGTILWVNERARQAHILPGQRYAHGLSLARELRAGVIAEAEVRRGVDAVAETLRRFSPEVEPADGEPGVFWLNGSGMGALFETVGAWARGIRAALREAGFHARVVAGFSRFGTYAVARDRGRAVTVFRDRETERAAADRVPLERLELEPALRDTLTRLGVHTVGAFVRLPPGGLLARFGREALRLHMLAAGERWDPLRPVFAAEPVERRILLDDPETDVPRLVFSIKRGLDSLLAQLARHGQALAALAIDLVLDRADDVQEIVRPAEPTLDGRALLRLVHLRLEASPPCAGVTELVLTVACTPATREQLSLFAQSPRRDLRAANEAFARLRAELGNDAVVKAAVCEGHLPEAQYRWLPLDHAVLPSPRHVDLRPLVRRVAQRPVLLPPPQSHQIRDDGWIVRGLERGAVVRFIGPYIVSGGWWAGDEVHREYHYALSRSGACLWVYYDRRRRRWFLHGEVG
jgi:protein ImuB